MQRILVGYDGSEAADRALGRAVELAKLEDCPLTVLTAAADRLPGTGHLLAPVPDEEPGRKMAEEGAERARRQGVLEVEARTSLEAPDDALVLAAGEGYDLLVVGHRGGSGLRELLLGSTAKAVVDRAPCSVLVVR